MADQRVHPGYEPTILTLCTVHTVAAFTALRCIYSTREARFWVWAPAHCKLALRVFRKVIARLGLYSRATWTDHLCGVLRKHVLRSEKRRRGGAASVERLDMCGHGMMFGAFCLFDSASAPSVTQVRRLRRSAFGLVIGTFWAGVSPLPLTLTLFGVLLLHSS